MRDHPRKIGRMTSAIGLIALGIVLLLDNILPLDYTVAGLVVRLWPLLLIGLGIEYLTAPPPRQFDFGGSLLLLLVLGLVIGYLSVGPVGTGARRSEIASVSAEGARGVAVVVDVGRVELYRQAANEVRVEASYGARGLFRRAGAFDLDVVPGETVLVTGRAPRGIRLGGLTATYRIYLPADMEVQVETRTGSIVVRDYDGNLLLRTGAGSIRVDSASGSLDAHTDSGSVLVHRFEGAVEARSRVGGLEIHQVSGDLSLHSGTGSIEVKEFRGSLAAETDTGSIRAESSTPLEGDVELMASTGSVWLALPDASDMTVTAQTQAGSISAPSFVTVTKQGASRSGEGTRGAGSHQVRLETRMGSIEFFTR